jgi:hypothetical protein
MDQGPQSGLRAKTSSWTVVRRKERMPAAEKRERWTMAKKMRPRAFRKLLERGARQIEAIFATYQTMPTTEPLLRNIAYSWWYIPPQDSQVVPSWWVTKHKILHSFVPVNWMNNTKAVIRRAAFRPGRVRVEPWIGPRDH